MVLGAVEERAGMTTTTTTRSDLGTLRSALYSVPSDDRETWVEMAMAVKSALGEDGFALWDEWSRQNTDPKHGYRAADAKAVWRSVRATGGVTVATLYHLAREHGWQGQEPVARGTQPRGEAATGRRATPGRSPPQAAG